MVNGTTKTHPTTATKGDVSYLQCKAVGRNLQDLKRIAAQEFLSDVYLDHVKPLTHSVFMLGYKGKVVNADFFSAKHRTTVAHFLNNEVPASQETRYCEDVANSFTYPLSVLHSFRVGRLIR